MPVIRSSFDRIAVITNGKKTAGRNARWRARDVPADSRIVVALTGRPIIRRLLQLAVPLRPSIRQLLRLRVYPVTQTFLMHTPRVGHARRLHPVRVEVGAG
jgi:hypothetical protein